MIIEVHLLYTHICLLLLLLQTKLSNSITEGTSSFLVHLNQYKRSLIGPFFHLLLNSVSSQNQELLFFFSVSFVIN